MEGVVPVQGLKINGEKIKFEDIKRAITTFETEILKDKIEMSDKDDLLEVKVDGEMFGLKVEKN